NRFGAVAAAHRAPNENVDVVADDVRMAITECYDHHARMRATRTHNCVFPWNVSNVTSNTAVIPAPVRRRDVVVFGVRVAGERPAIGVISIRRWYIKPTPRGRKHEL